MTLINKSQLLALFVCCCCCTNFVFSNYIISCKPCTSILDKCNGCSNQIKCRECSSNLNNTQCSKCFDDIFREKNIYCEQENEYQFLACSINCQVKEQINGVCDPRTGLCTCASDDLILQILSFDGSLNSSLKVDLNSIVYLSIILNIFLI